MPMKNKLKSASGVSMIALAITVIVIVIIAAVIMGSNSDSIESAARAVFIQEIKDVETFVSAQRLDNQIQGTNEEKMNKGFYKAYVENPPVDFVSFSKNSIYGYVVDLELIEYEDAKYGNDYEKYMTDPESNNIKFGTDDVYIYDARGKMFYAKGYESEEGIYFTADEAENEGPKVETEKIIVDDRNITIKVIVTKVNNGDVTVTIGEETAIKTTENGKKVEFETTVKENKTYKIVANESGAGKTTTSVIVTEINAEEYTITYDANGGDVDSIPEAQTKTENVELRLSTKIPTRTGYTFLGWAPDSAAKIAIYRAGAIYVTNSDVTLYAVWQAGAARSYSITYSANGGINAPRAQNNVSGEVTLASTIPTYEGYGFDGWCEDAKGTSKKYAPGEKITVTKNIVLYAIWVKDSKTVTLEVNAENAGTVTGGGAKVKDATVLIKATPNAGYVFKEWVVNSGGVTLQNKTSATTTFKMPARDVKITAKFEKIGLTVRYDANKGINAPESVSVNHGDEITITSEIPTREGYTFLGWSLTSTALEGNEDYAAGKTYIVNSNTVFYAVWQKKVKEYKIKFDLDGGTGDFETITKFEDKNSEVPTEIPTKEGFVFSGWALSQTIRDIMYRPGDPITTNSDATLYAIWADEIIPTVTLTAKQEGNDLKLIAKGTDKGLIGSYAWTYTDEVPTSWDNADNVDEEVTIEKIANKKGTNYIWMRDKQGNYNKASIDLYEITYNLNGGLNGPTKQYKAKDKEMTITNELPIRSDYIFLGWSTSQNPGNNMTSVNYKATDTYTENADITLKAVWGNTKFTLSSISGTTRIGGDKLEVTIQKNEHTGTIDAKSSDEEVAVASAKDNLLTITPGTKVGSAEITLTENTGGTTAKYTVTVNKGIRKLTINETAKTFVYGDTNGSIGFNYDGKETTVTLTSSNENIATAKINGKVVEITPKNLGTAKITLTLAEDDMYVSSSEEINVSVNKKELIVIPKNGQGRIYDGTKNTPELTYEYKGAVGSEEPDFEGALTRTEGADAGKYEIKLGSLSLKDNDRKNFKKDNYEIKLSETKVYYEITPKTVAFPVANTEQTYDGTMKAVVPEGTEYIRGGEYEKKEAGTYIAKISLKDTKNTMWADDKTNYERNITWKITALSAENNLRIEDIASVTYTGKEIKPEITVRDASNNKLTLNDDYTVIYRNNTNVGTATVVVEGKGNFKGSVTKNFEITKANMTVTEGSFTGVYDGANHGITVKVTNPQTGATIYYAEEELTSANYVEKGTTNKKTYKDAGTKTVYYYIVDSNFNDYKGSKTVTITPKSIVTNITQSELQNKDYTGTKIEQTITLKDNDLNKTLIKDTDYNVEYTNNENVGVATVTITGIGNYTGTRTSNFEIAGDIISFRKSTEALASEMTVTISKTNANTSLEYKIDNSNWETYTGPIEVTKDCTVYARSVHNGNEIGNNSLVITNICEHSYSEATCTEDGICAYCKDVKEEALGHEYTVEDTSSIYKKSDATCTRGAIYYYKCVRCTEHGSETFETGTAREHNYTEEIQSTLYLRTNATCEEAATYYYKCSRCTAKGEEWYSYGENLAHEYSYITTKQATCTDSAEKQATCVRCAYSYTYESGTPLGHVAPGSYEITETEHYKNCTRCEEELERETHTWQNVTTTKKECTVCGATADIKNE